MVLSGRLSGLATRKDAEKRREHGKIMINQCHSVLSVLPGVFSELSRAPYEDPIWTSLVCLSILLIPHIQGPVQATVSSEAKQLRLLLFDVRTDENSD
jgi:hypothetical protein